MFCYENNDILLQGIALSLWNMLHKMSNVPYINYITYKIWKQWNTKIDLVPRVSSNLDLMTNFLTIIFNLCMIFLKFGIRVCG